MTVQNSLESAEVVVSLATNGIFVAAKFLDVRVTEKLKVEFTSLFSRQLRGVRPEQHPPGKSVRIRPREVDEKSIPTIMNVFTLPIFWHISSHYLPNNSSFGHDIIAAHETKNVQLTDIHFDMLRSLKFMIYLLDTDETNGAFAYALGSHKINAVLRRRFLTCGGKLAELPNVASELENIQLTRICAPAGSVIIFDTDGFHAGGHISPGRERKILRMRSVVGTQTVSPRRFTWQWCWQSRLNPLRLFTPDVPKGRRSTQGTARAAGKGQTAS